MQQAMDSNSWQEELFKDSQRLTYKKGEIIQRPFDKPQGIYWIEQGVVKTYSVTSTGEERVQVNYIETEIFPLAWAVLGADDNVFYQALTDCTLIRLSRESFYARAVGNPAISYGLFRQAVGQFVNYAERLHNMEYKYASERLAYRLLLLGKRLGTVEDGHITIRSVTQRDIANSINVTPESLSRELDKLRRKGLISGSGKKITLCDIKGLIKEISGELPFDMPLNS